MPIRNAAGSPLLPCGAERRVCKEGATHRHQGPFHALTAQRRRAARTSLLHKIFLQEAWLRSVSPQAHTPLQWLWRHENLKP